MYTQIKRLFSNDLLGQFVIFVSAFCFYLETAGVRWAATRNIALSTPYLVFARFLIGFLVVLLVFFFRQKTPHPRRYSFLIARAITNLFAVLTFYRAVQVTPLAESNILNMTFPIFIAIFSWFIFRKQRDRLAFLMTIVAFCGIFLILSPGELQIEWNRLWGLTSAILGASSLILLNIARQDNDTNSVMFVVFGIGTFLLFIVFHRQFHLPDSTELFYLVFCAAMGISGQYLLTLGFRYVTAVEGGIICSVRILIAAFLGPYITSDPSLTLSGWLGALLILVANIYFITRRTGVVKG